MFIESEASMGRRLEFNELHSDAESVTPSNPRQLSQYATPQKSTSIPYCGICFIPDCDEAIKPNKGMIFDDLESAKEFYEYYAHTVGFSVRIGQHKKVNGLVLYKRFLCANEGFREDKVDKDLDSGRNYCCQPTKCR
uniref:FAR1 domain-containing protein n=1 Tax=Oryza meridionalis TaxID=40149 RepID=A0A0E0FDW7_9ORYZ